MKAADPLVSALRTLRKQYKEARYVSFSADVWALLGQVLEPSTDEGETGKVELVQMGTDGHVRGVSSTATCSAGTTCSACSLLQALFARDS